MTTVPSSTPFIPLSVGHWPWQRSLQTRIILTYGAVFLLVLIFLTVRVAQIIYSTRIDEAGHELELKAYLIAHALEDPVSGYATEFSQFDRWERLHGIDQDHDNDKSVNSPGGLVPALAGADSGHHDLPDAAPPPPSTFVSARLQQIAITYAADTQAQVTILSPEGDAVADSSRAINTIANQSQRIEVQAALEDRAAKDIRADPTTGASTLYAAAPIIQQGQVLGIVHISTPMKVVIADTRRLLTTLIATSLLALAVATVCAVWLGRRLVQPVRDLENAALAIAGGDLNQQVTVSSTDELGALAQAFNYMVDEVRRMLEQQRLFVANASHELRTPVTNIKLRSEALLSIGPDDPATTKRYLQQIDSEADRLGRLANALLDLLRLQSTKHDASEAPRTAISAVLANILDRMQLQAQTAGIRLTVDLPSDLPEIQIWPESLEMILVNLVDNAIKYSGSSGTVHVAARATRAGCEVSVTDNGPGIPQEDIPYIFDRFYRVDKARSRRKSPTAGMGSGAGLGLSITKTLAEQCRGKIRVESELGQGSKFIVEFPAAAYGQTM